MCFFEYVLREERDTFITITLPRATRLVRICRIVDRSVRSRGIRVQFSLHRKLFIGFQSFSQLADGSIVTASLTPNLCSFQSSLIFWMFFHVWLPIKSFYWDIHRTGMSTQTCGSYCWQSPTRPANAFWRHFRSFKLSGRAEIIVELEGHYNPEIFWRYTLILSPDHTSVSEFLTGSNPPNILPDAFEDEGNYSG